MRIILEEKGGKGRGLKSSCESILLFKLLPFSPIPSKIKTPKHTLRCINPRFCLAGDLMVFNSTMQGITDIILPDINA